MDRTKPWILRTWWASALAGVVLVAAAADMATEHELVPVIRFSFVAIFAFGGLCFLASALHELRSGAPSSR